MLVELSPKFQRYVEPDGVTELSANWTSNGEQPAKGSGENITTGSGLIETVTCAVEVHPLRFPVTVYVVGEVGFALTLEPVDVLNDVDGLHE